MTSYRLARRSDQGLMLPEQHGWGGEHDPTRHPGLIVPFEFDGVSFGGVHRDFRNVLHNLCLDLVPHIPHGLHTGEEGCFVDRSIRGSTSRSLHSYGIAADFNWTHNPMGQSSNYGHPYVLPKLSEAIAERWGCQWGGIWSGRRDAMHIECHLPRSVARRVRYRSRFVTVQFRRHAPRR